MKLLKQILFAMLLGNCAASFATTIVTVEGMRVIKKSNRGQEIEKKLLKEEKRLANPLNQLKEKLQKKEAEILKKQKEFNKKAKELEDSAKILSEEAQNRAVEQLQEEKQTIEEEASELQRLGRKYNTETQHVKDRLTKINEKEMTSFNEEITQTIQEVAKEFGWDIVLMQESLVYSAPKVDKTDIIIERLNKYEEKRIKDKIAKDRKELLKDESELSKLKQQVSASEKATPSK